MAEEPRVIRVFVSSTFLDMKAERDELVLKVFPQLRRLCLSRGVTWNEVDLRWGITEEESERGEVLPICLEEIRRCRPFFIGLLAERYGHVQIDVPADVVDREPWLEQHLSAEKSITELEILHGALNDPESSGQAFFYFRDPEYADRLPPGSSLDDFVCMDPESARKLAELKQRIRTEAERSRCHLRSEQFSDAQELGRWVLADMTALINRLFPEEEVPDATEFERLEHESMARRMVRGFVPRASDFERLDEFASSGAKVRSPLIVCGPSGIGKSAVLANWGLRRQETESDEYVVMRFLGGSAMSSEPAHLLRQIMLELQEQLALDGKVPVKEGEVFKQFPHWVERAGLRKRIVIIIDGLDQLTRHGRGRRLAWMPREIPPNVKLVVSANPGETLDALHSREWNKQTAPLRIEQLSLQEKRAIALQVLEASSRKLAPHQLDRLVQADQTSNPLFLRSVLEELHVIGDHPKLDTQISDYLKAESPRELFVRIVERWCEAYSEGKDLARQVLRLVWAARRGLSEGEILDLLGTEDVPAPRAHLAPFLLAADGSLAQRSGVLTFANDYVRDAVGEDIARRPGEEQRLRDRIAEHFERQEEMTRRKAEELPWALVKIEEWVRLHELLSDPAYVVEAADLDIDHVEASHYWGILESKTKWTVESVFHRFRENPELGQALDVGSLMIRTGRSELAVRVRSFATTLFRMAEAPPHLVAGALREESQALRQAGRFPEALRRLLEAEQLLLECGDKSSLSYNHLDMAELLVSMGRAIELDRYIQEGSKLAEELGNERLSQLFRLMRSDAMRAAGDHAQAVKVCREEVQELRQHSDPRRLASALGDLGRALLQLGRCRESWDCHKEEEDLSRYLNEPNGIAAALFGQVNVLKALEEYEAALGVLQSIIEIGTQDAAEAARVKGTEAGILQEMGEFDRALVLHEEEITMFRASLDRRGLVVALLNKAILLGRRMEQPKQGYAIAKEALEVATDSGQVELAGTAKRLLTEFGGTG